MKLRNLILVLLILVISACGTVTVELPTPVSGLQLPDLVVASMNVAMVDASGRCVDGYQIFASVLNQGVVPAENVTAVEMATGQSIIIGTLEAGQKMDVQMSAVGANGTYVVVVDPQNVIDESNETNNNLSFLLPTPTAYVGCAPVPQPMDATPTPVPFITPAPFALDGLIYADPGQGQVLMGDPGLALMQGVTYVNFSSNGLQALFERSGDIFLAEPMDNPGRNITNTTNSLELLPQWWPGRPSKIVFHSMGVNEAQEKGWARDYLGYVTLMNIDGSEYQVLGDGPSLSKPAMSPDGKTVAFDQDGWPMLYEIGSGRRAFDAAQFGFMQTPGDGFFFTSPSFSSDGRWLTWWVSQDESVPQRSFSLVVFDLVGKTHTTLYSYNAPGEIRGWLDNPVWSPNGWLIAFHARFPDSAGELWIAQIGGAMLQRIRLGTNPVWSPDGTHIAYIQYPPAPELDPLSHLSIIEFGSWNTQQTNLPPGSIPLNWIQRPNPQSSYFPMFSAPPDWLTHSNMNPAYQVQYPPGVAIESYPERLTINIPFQSGTQMTEKSLRIETRITSEQECFAAYQWEGTAELNGLQVRYRGGKYLEHAAAGQSFIIGNYAAYDNGFCYDILTRVALRDDSSFTGNTPLPAPSREDMDFSLLLYIVSTLRVF